eukprot:COSAG01_NODE_46709_length_397_cov_2.228188_1_plen_40_part_10
MYCNNNNTHIYSCIYIYIYIIYVILYYISLTVCAAIHRPK